MVNTNDDAGAPPVASPPQTSPIPPTAKDVERALLSAIGATGARLRDEDARKVDELVPLLAEMARLLPGRKPAVVVDACAGKSIVGVLAKALLWRDRPVRIVAIERDAARAAACTHAAQALGVADATRFVHADVADLSAWPKADLVVALHACGAAADAILDAAVATAAKRLLVLPCCYGDAAHAAIVRSSDGTVIGGDRFVDRRLQAVPLPRHALVRRRFVQALVDAERTLRLERAGYRTEVVELIPPTVTPFALAWRALRVGEPKRMAEAAGLHADLTR
jgi:hypothetical protein